MPITITTLVWRILKVKHSLFRFFKLSMVLYFLHFSQALAENGFVVQGMIESTEGLQVDDGNYSMRFTLIDSASRSTLWSKSIASVPVSRGTFSTFLVGSGDSQASLESLFLLPPIFSGSGPRALSLNIDVDLDNDGNYEDGFHDLPVNSVPFSMIANRSYGVMDGSITTQSLAPLSITSSKIADGALELSKLAQNNAVLGSIIQWDGNAWIAAPLPGVSGGTTNACMQTLSSSNTISPLSSPSGTSLSGTIMTGNLGSSGTSSASMIFSFAVDGDLGIGAGRDA